MLHPVGSHRVFFLLITHQFSCIFKAIFLFVLCTTRLYFHSFIFYFLSISCFLTFPHFFFFFYKLTLSIIQNSLLQTYYKSYPRYSKHFFHPSTIVCLGLLYIDTIFFFLLLVISINSLCT